MTRANDEPEGEKPLRFGRAVKGPLLTLGVVKGPFLTSGAVKDPFSASRADPSG